MAHSAEIIPDRPVSGFARTLPSVCTESGNTDPKASVCWVPPDGVIVITGALIDS